MFGYYYTPILALQAFCMYHAYNRRVEQFWYWLIIFFPPIGPLFYLYKHFYTPININQLGETLKETVDSGYKVKKLEKELNFSDTVENKMRLADAYMQQNQFEAAYQLYQSCLNGIHKNDVDILKKTLMAAFANKDYAQAIVYGKQLEHDKFFKKSEERAALAWAYHYNGQNEAAEQEFKAMDSQFANYIQRIEYAKFLFNLGRKTDASAKLDTMLTEIEHMDSVERRSKRNYVSEIKSLQTQFKRAV